MVEKNTRRSFELSLSAAGLYMAAYRFPLTYAWLESRRLCANVVSVQILYLEKQKQLEGEATCTSKRMWRFWFESHTLLSDSPYPTGHFPAVGDGCISQPDSIRRIRNTIRVLIAIENATNDTFPVSVRTKKKIAAFYLRRTIRSRNSSMRTVKSFRV